MCLLKSLENALFTRRRRSRFYDSDLSPLMSGDTVPEMRHPEAYFEENRIFTDIMHSARAASHMPMTDSDYELGHSTQPNTPTRIGYVSLMDVIILNNALYKQFPVHSPFYHPPLYNWINLKEISPQAFPTTWFKSIRRSYQKMKPDLVVLNMSALPTISEVPLTRLRPKYQGRILFHYIGYGFPPVSEKNIWLPGPIELPLNKLFQSLTAPSFFIFDCDNAGVVIDALHSLAPDLPKRSVSQMNMIEYQDGPVQIEWADCFVLCATSKGEELPKDPQYPRDLLTSILLTPVKTALYLSSYTSFWSSTQASGNNRLEYSTDQIQQLESLLSVIVDSIVCDCLPSNLLHHLFRSGGTTTRLFKNFVLAQYVFRSIGIHPISKPELPDMSSHKLWEYWKAAVDNTIGSVERPALTLTDEYYAHATVSFNNFLEAKAYRKIAPSLLETMIQAGNFSSASRLLMEYPPARELLAEVIVFRDIFSKLITVPKKDSSFQYLCYLIVCIFASKPDLVYEIPSMFDWNILLEIVFDTQFSPTTRTLVSAILANSSGCNKTLRGIISTPEMIQRIQGTLRTAPSLLFVWLFMIVKKAFDVFSADVDIFVPSGFHIQCCVGAFHHSPECRAASIAILPSFFQGDITKINIRLLIYALPTFTDISYLVRHQLILLIIRYLTTHQDEIIRRKEYTEVSHKSFRSMAEEFIVLPKGENIRGFFTEIEERLDTLITREQIDQLVEAFVIYFSHDPHPVIAKEASAAREFLCQTRKGRRNTDDDYYTYLPQESDSEALCSIVMRQTLEQSIDDPPSSACETAIGTYEALTDTHGSSRQPFLPIHTIQTSFVPAHIAFDPLTCGIAAADANTVSYYDGSTENARSVNLPNGIITDMKIACWFNEPCAVVSKSNGTCAMWKVRNMKPSGIWRADPNTGVDGLPMHVALASNTPRIATVRGSNYTIIWDVATLKMACEFENFENVNATAIAIHPSDSNLVITGFEDGTTQVRDIRSGSITAAYQNLAHSPVIKVVGNARENSTIYTAFQNGTVYKSSSGVVDSWNLMSKYELRDFDAHPTLPVMLFTTKSQAKATFANEDGSMFTVLKGVPADSIGAIHPTQSVFAIGTPDREIRIFKANTNR